MDNTTWVILNPAAGGGRAEKLWPALSARLTEAGIAFTPGVTCGVGDATHLAREALAAGAERIIVVGGDGTLNEVAHGCLSDGVAIDRPVTLALVPIGTGADFARGLGIADEAMALRALRHGATRQIDAGEVTYRTADGGAETRHFVNVADFGLGPITSRMIATGPKALGAAVYAYGALRAIATYRPNAIRVTVDDRAIYDGPSGLVAVANGRYFGGGMAIAPEADLEDGHFDVVLVGAVTRFALAARLLPRVYRGTHLTHQAVRLVRGNAVTITSDTPFPLEVDGEIVGHTPARFALRRKALGVLVPPTR